MKNELTFPNKMRTPSAFEVSQLLNKPGPKWEKRVEELDEQKRFRVLEYKPLRDAIIAEMRHPGTGWSKLDEGLDGYNSGFSTDAMIAAMRACFALFEKKINRHIAELKECYTEPPVKYAFKIDDYDITGSIHARVTHRRYGDRLIYLYSSQWMENEVKAFQELIIMLAEQVFSMRAEDVLWCDLRAGTCKPLKSRPSLRSDIAWGIRHYYRTFRQ